MGFGLVFVKACMVEAADAVFLEVATTNKERARLFCLKGSNMS